MKRKKLSEIAFLLNGYAFKSSKYVKQGIRIIRIANVQDGYIVDEKPCFYPIDINEDISKYMLEENDILVSLTGNVGRVGLVKNSFLPSALNQRVCCIRIKDTNAIDNKFLFFYLRRKNFVKDCVNASNGVAQLNLSPKWLNNYFVPIPSLPEQKRIVSKIEELFSRLDAGVEKLKKTKTQLAVYRQAVLKEAFSCCTEKKPIRNLSQFVTSGSRGWSAFYSDEGARFIRITDLNRKGIKLNNNSIQYVRLPERAEGKRSRLQKGDVLVSITADLGCIALIPENIGEAYINQHIAMIRLNNPGYGKFMAWYLRSEWGQKDLLKNKRGGGKLGLGLDDIRDTPVPVVSNEEAGRILSYIDARLSLCDSIEQIMDTALQQSDAMRQSVLKDAFNGKQKYK